MSRHVVKTASFAALHFSVAFGVTYAVTGSWRVSGAVAIIEPMVNTVVFFFHELFWSRQANVRTAVGHALSHSH